MLWVVKFRIARLVNFDIRTSVHDGKDKLAQLDS
jgi:hypothetical protein